MPEGDNPQGGNEQQLQALLEKHKGDAMALAMALFGDNFKLREKNRTLKEQVPAEGSVMLKKEDADRLTAFDALGKPEEVKAKLEAAGTLETENVTLKRETALRQVADAGYSYDALKDFDALEGGLTFVPKDETKDGKAMRIWHVKDGDKERPLDEYAKEKRPALASILKAEGQPSGGIPYPAQSAGGRAPAKDIYQKQREAAKASQTTARDDVHPIFQKGPPVPPAN